MLGKAAISDDIIDRLLEDKLYEQVALEISRGIKRDGLWLKALSNVDGKEERAKKQVFEEQEWLSIVLAIEFKDSPF